MADQTKTAPVDEYRVMWTTNKTQKIKKWHDGFLRYHSFNRRMLVYDDGRHLVADMYLRDREFLGEGDELEFEHHLVSIEDFHGSVNQDLTPIFSPALQRKQAAVTAASTVQTPTPNRRREPVGASRGGIAGAQSARQQRPATREPFTPTTVQGESRDVLGNGHMTTPSRPAQAPTTVPRMNGQGKRNGVTSLNTPGRQDYPPVAGPGRGGQVNRNMGVDMPGPQARAPIPAYRGNGQVNGNMNTNPPVRNSHPTRQHIVYQPQANEQPINFGRTGSPAPQRAPPPAPPQPALCHQNHNTRSHGRAPPLVTEVAQTNAQLPTRRPPPPQRPQHQPRNKVLERGRPVTTSRQMPAQVNRSGSVTQISPPMPQGRPVSRANQNYPVSQQTEPPAQQRHSPPAPRPGGRPPPVTHRVPSPVPAPPPAPAQAPPDEPAPTALATLSKIRQFSAPSRARPPRQPTAPPPPPQRSPESIQVPSSAAEPPPHISRSPSPRDRPPPPPPLPQNQTSIPNSRSPSPTHNPINRPPKRPSTVNDANQPPTKRTTQFQSARRLVEQEQDEIHDVDDSDDNNVAGPIRQGPGVIKLSSTSGPKKKMLLCARPPTFKFPPKRPEGGGDGNGDENRERPKTIIDEEDYDEWDDEIMSMY
ncbi:unnamed protein product [Tuber melanosporum]|uniref:(Perigord truffle) hypothetical protein n=1 Tax=Tuber melanosporum (strain Mel28) TaxID=656061 RepID=D5G9I8_TUBMM|nr:uncharacterized protein GSTUM_00003343001 [Tuber melanosporum]CAZ81181.1 unnamed protein product [Tuber melanosporum]